MDPCKPQACAIQGMYPITQHFKKKKRVFFTPIWSSLANLLKDCLKRTNYDESKCTKLIDQLYECCSKFYQENGEDSKTPCCPIPGLLKLKVEQRQKEKKDAQLLR